MLETIPGVMAGEPGTPGRSRGVRDHEQLYRSMVFIRAFENAVQALFARGLVRGSTHLATGQEAVAVGVGDTLEPDDLVFAMYRGHHHCLARGMDAAAAFAEILGRATGVCGGKGGSMHLTDVGKGVMGSYAVVGAHLPIAVGAAWAAQLRGTGQVVACFFGDGTTTIGAFHEAVNMAAVWRLPVVFVCENNLYSEYTPIHEVVPVEHPAADRATAYGIEGVLIDGNDVLAVRDAAATLVERARSGGGPSILEAQTYRQGGHSRSDPGTYRPAEEVEHWLARDPVVRLAREIGDISPIDEEVSAQIDAALEEALAAPPPPDDALFMDVFAAPIEESTWRS